MFQPSVMDRAQFYFLLSCESFAGLLQLPVILCPRRIYSQATTFALFVNKISRALQVDPNESDKIEVYIRFLITIVFQCTAGTFAMLLFFMHSGVHLLAPVASAPIGLQVLLAALETFDIFFCWLAVFFFVVLLLIYVNTLQRSLDRLRAAGLRSAELDRRIRLYRAHQVLNQVAMGETRHIFAGGLTIATGLIIAALFFVIAFHSSIQPLIVGLIGSIGFTAVVVTHQLLLIMGRVATESAKFPDSFLRKELHMRKVHSLAFKACPVIHIEAGHFIRVSAHTFSNLMVEVVIANVINLLVVTESWGWQ